jgi:polyisoprenoid-binding protein YceI
MNIIIKKSTAIALFAMVLVNNCIVAQKFFTKTGNVSFNSTATLEKIEATNKSANCVFDAATTKMEWGVLVKGFQFEKALMQEHFNENYMESTKFPKATFKGTVSGFDPKKSGTQSVKVTGDLTMHGVTKPLATTGTMTVKDGNIVVDAVFSVALADYKIDIPAVVKDQIAKTVKIKVSTSLAPLK